MEDNMFELNQTLIKPRFCEIDSLKIAHHSRFVPWFEEATFNFVEKVIGISRANLMDMNIFNPIYSLNCQYKKGVKWDDTILVNTHMVYSEFAYFIMESTMASADDPSICFAEAQIKHIYTDNNLKLRLKAPEEFYQKIDQAAKKYPNYFSKE